MTEMRAERWIIAGRVQGVGYRDWMVRTADALGVAGHVRNHADGTVLASVSASASVLDELYRACLEGPPGASVAGIDRATLTDSAELRCPFARIPTNWP